ncbi:MAG: hypothetical protein PHY93_13105 [Bacteriovorax sp.]|nr:hypothetical protein [Bacteriovorax sp.]
MKNFMKGFIYLSCIGLVPVAHAVPGDLGLSASSIKLKIYKMAVSTSPLCTNLITVLDNGTSPTEVDFLQNPNLGSGTLADGTYPCIVIEFSDLVKFTPSNTSTSGNCNSATEYTLDVCRAGGSTSVLINGTTTNCTGTSGTNTTYGTPGDDRVAMYISTATTGGADVFNRPTSIGDNAHGLNLGAALTISGTSSGKFVANPAGQVCDNNTAACESGPGGGNKCEMGPPAFSFTKI